MDKSAESYKPYQTRGRFYLEESENIPGGWMVVDRLDGCLVDFENFTQASDHAAFFRAYVKKHGDIDLLTVPYSLETPLSYDEGIDKRGWLSRALIPAR